jgi:hypothetical protein
MLGVLQLAGDACLAEEALSGRRICRVTISQQLDGNVAIKSGIAGSVDDAHVARSDRAAAAG